MVEEIRHCALLGQIASDPSGPSKSLQTLFGCADSLGPTPAGIVCLHGILEGLLLAQLRTCRDFWKRRPAVGSLFQSVAADEARHVAFGRHWMAGWRRDSELSACDSTLADVVTMFQSCMDDDDGYSEMSARRRSEYDNLGGGHLAQAVEPLAAALTDLALPRSAREVRRLLQG